MKSRNFLVYRAISLPKYYIEDASTQEKVFVIDVLPSRAVISDMNGNKIYKINISKINYTIHKGEVLLARVYPQKIFLSFFNIEMNGIKLICRQNLLKNKWLVKDTDGNVLVEYIKQINSVKQLHRIFIHDEKYYDLGLSLASILLINDTSKKSGD